MDRREFIQAAAVTTAAALALNSEKEASAANSQTEMRSEEKKNMKKIIIAADPFAVDLKDSIKTKLIADGYEVEDVGSQKGQDIAYYDCAPVACKKLQKDPTARGILLCGSGMGMSIVANRFAGIHASVVESVFAAKMCRAINNANVLCLGAMIWGDWMAKEAVDVFLNTKFTQGLEGLEDFLQGAYKTVNSIKD
ncbi:MAG: RpiB/LacA/LacB family sugar-phosphate isomerase [Thermoguttaceae bacterium]|nr:RpiB/LacA/LacB family sugar-phosphate isomerase [Planctomycetaceae bacterium]MBQ4143150.1 RpiB/LacA/LacB family sugar-phosphate isomerase [Thermoguttaceae bacterium]